MSPVLMYRSDVFRCNECSSTDIVTDIPQGNMVCRSCGLLAVFDECFPDSNEHGGLVSQNLKFEKPLQCPDVPKPCFFAAKSVHQDSTNSILYKAKSICKHILLQLHIPDEKCCHNFLEELHRKKILHYKKIPFFCAVVVKFLQETTTFSSKTCKEVADVVHVQEKEVSKALHDLKKIVMPSNDNFVHRFCTALEVSFCRVETVLSILNTSCIFRSFDPPCLVAISIMCVSQHSATFIDRVCQVGVARLNANYAYLKSLQLFETIQDALHLCKRVRSRSRNR